MVENSNHFEICQFKGGGNFKYIVVQITTGLHTESSKEL